MTAQSTLAAALERKPPPLGGFSPAILRLEVRRLLRNRRTMVLALVVPVLFFWSIGLNDSYVHQTFGRGNLSAGVDRAHRAEVCVDEHRHSKEPPLSSARPSVSEPYRVRHSDQRRSARAERPSGRPGPPSRAATCVEHAGCGRIPAGAT